MRRIIDLLIIAIVVLLSGCKDDKRFDEPAKPVEEKTVVVILPMDNGLRTQWERTFTLFAHNSSRAFSNQQEKVRRIAGHAVHHGCRRQRDIQGRYLQP